MHSTLAKSLCGMQATQYIHWLIVFQKSDLLFIKHVMSCSHEMFSFLRIDERHLISVNLRQWNMELNLLESVP